MQELISLLLDRKLPDGEREKVLAHTRWCRECGAHLETLQQMRAGLLAMAPLAVPPALSDRLRVLASHERSRHLARMNFATRRQDWSEWIRLGFDNLMRPFALPFTGGIVSALLVFGLLVPNLSFPHNYGDETRTIDFTFPDGAVVGATGDADNAPRIEPLSAPIFAGERAIDLVIDDQGKVRGGVVTHGDVTPDMINVILFSRFTPATYSGQPTWGPIRVVFPHHRRGVRS
ncbi:MAG TPA: zf-HC2 domain-containing protein [Candidatus Acidoferrales bacterium]|nr:zf-HC2 domain-containing protein [Candidatus Acidoferrales bacterium]